MHRCPGRRSERQFGAQQPGPEPAAAGPTASPQPRQPGTARHPPIRPACRVCAAASVRRPSIPPDSGSAGRPPSRNAAAAAQATPGLRPCGRALQFVGHRVVRFGRRVGLVPDAAVLIEVWIGRFREGAMSVLADPPAKLPGKTTDRTCGWWNRKLAADVHRVLLRPRARRRRRSTPSRAAAPPHQRWITDRLGRRHQQESPGCHRQGLPGGDENRPRSAPSRSARRAARTCLRVLPASDHGGSSSSARGFPCDSATIRSAHPFVHSAPWWTDLSNARAASPVQALNQQLGRPASAWSPAGLPNREHQSDRLSPQPPGDEGQRLEGGIVEPLRVVGDADQRLHLSGRRPAAWRTASPTWNRSWQTPRPGDRTPPASASPCGPGRRSRWVRKGAHNWCRPANASSSPTRLRRPGRCGSPPRCAMR